MAGITNLKSHTIIIRLLHKVVYMKGRLSFNPFLKVFQSSVCHQRASSHIQTPPTPPPGDRQNSQPKGVLPGFFIQASQLLKDCCSNLTHCDTKRNL